MRGKTRDIETGMESIDNYSTLGCEIRPLSLRDQKDNEQRLSQPKERHQSIIRVEAGKATVSVCVCVCITND